MHIASSKFHPMYLKFNEMYYLQVSHLIPARYKFPKFIGGIMIMKNEDFRAINGLSNKYWGWGRVCICNYHDPRLIATLTVDLTGG